MCLLMDLPYMYQPLPGLVIRYIVTTFPYYGMPLHDWKQEDSSRSLRWLLAFSFWLASCLASVSASLCIIMYKSNKQEVDIILISEF